MSTRAHQDYLLFWAAVVTVWAIAGLLGLDHALGPWLTPSPRLLAFRTAYVVVAGGLLALLMRRRYGTSALRGAALGAVAGYAGSVVGYIAMTFAMGQGWERLASITRLKGPLAIRIGWVFLLLFISPAWLWTAIGAGLGILAGRWTSRTKVAAEPSPPSV
jgi:hypothetical protein